MTYEMDLLDLEEYQERREMAYLMWCVENEADPEATASAIAYEDWFADMVRSRGGTVGTR